MTFPVLQVSGFLKYLKMSWFEWHSVDAF